MASTQGSAGVYDIIFVGGGAAGCVTAGRLAAANPSLKILVLEAGPHSRDVEDHIQPARYFANLMQPNKVRKNFTLHVGQPSNSLLNRSLIVPAARVLGGGSCVNFMVYTRAAASDYDAWETDFGNKGWASKDLIPLLRKVETYQSLPANPTSDPSALVHGDRGPLKISFQKESANVAEQFLEVAGLYDKERGLTDDFNDFHATSTNKYGPWAKYIDEKTGRRSDTAHNFIYNQERNTNLTVMTEKRAVRVLFEGTKATGVEYIDEEDKVKGGDSLAPASAFASRLVVLSAGAFGSPAILERSGIGSEKVLQQNGVPQLVDLPGVGENYLDHNLIFTHYVASDEAETVDEVFHGSQEEIEPHAKEWWSEGTGLLTHNGLDAGIKLRPTAMQLAEMGPAFEERWNSFFANAPDKPVMFTGVMAAFTAPDPPVPKGKYFNMLYCSGYPISTGRVHIAQGLDPYGPLAFDPGYLADLGDVVILRWAYKHMRELARRMPFYRGEVEAWHPLFPPGSGAACKGAATPAEIGAPNLVYTPQDDEAIDLYHRRMVNTSWHSAGTCAMKSRARGGVVDERLNVYGTSHLKVADLSICPGNVGANTYNTALAVGEKAAVIIAEDLGLNLDGA